MQPLAPALGILLVTLAAVPARAGSREKTMVVENANDHVINLEVQERIDGKPKNYVVVVEKFNSTSFNIGFTPGQANAYVECIKVRGENPEKWCYTKDMLDNEGRRVQQPVATPWHFVVSDQNTIETFQISRWPYPVPRVKTPGGPGW